MARTNATLESLIRIWVLFLSLRKETIVNDETVELHAPDDMGAMRHVQLIDAKAWLGRRRVIELEMIFDLAKWSEAFRASDQQHAINHQLPYSPNRDTLLNSLYCLDCGEAGNQERGRRSLNFQKKARGNNPVKVDAYRMEVRLTLIALCVAIISTAFFLSDLHLVAAAELSRDRFMHVAMAGIFAAIVLAFLYANVAYFLSRIGSANTACRTCPRTNGRSVIDLRQRSTIAYSISSFLQGGGISRKPSVAIGVVV